LTRWRSGVRVPMSLPSSTYYHLRRKVRRRTACHSAAPPPARYFTVSPGPGGGCKIGALWPDPPRNKDCVHRNPLNSDFKIRTKFRRIWIPSKRLRKNLFRPAIRRRGFSKLPNQRKRNRQIRHAKSQREIRSTHALRYFKRSASTKRDAKHDPRMDATTERLD
jgi:hypothetical protein